MVIDKICPKCNSTFTIEVVKGYGRTYCSRNCANSRTMGVKVRQKISHSVRNTWDTKSEAGKQKAIEALRRGHASRSKKSLERVLTLTTEELGHDSRKKKVFLEQGEKCNKCGIVDWNDMALTFELEHKDGNKHNNLRDNLEVLCPNCHSQTHTRRGRNNKRG